MSLELINKSFLGFLISQNRKSKNLTRKNIVEISKIKGFNLSESTIRRIEAGDSSVKDDFWIKYAEILNIKLTYNEDAFEELLLCRDQVFSFLNSFNKLSNLSFLKNKINLLHKKYCDCLYITTMLDLYSSIIELYCNGQITNHYLLPIMKKSLNLFNGKDLILISYYIYEYIIRKRTKDDTLFLCGQILYDYKMFDLDRIFYDLYINKSKISVLNLYPKYEKLLNSKLNSIDDFFSAFSLAIIAMVAKDYDKAIIFANKALDIEDICTYIPNWRLLYLKQIEAIALYNQNRYIDCIASINKILNTDDSMLNYTYLLVYKSLEKLNDKKSLSLIYTKGINSNNKFIKATSLYCKEKHTGANPEYLEEILMSQILNDLYIPAFYSSIIEDELKMLVEQTKKYKNYYKYKQLVSILAY